MKCSQAFLQVNQFMLISIIVQMGTLLFSLQVDQTRMLFGVNYSVHMFNSFLTVQLALIYDYQTVSRVIHGNF